jgi:hypothetical protein
MGINANMTVKHLPSLRAGVPAYIRILCGHVRSVGMAFFIREHEISQE